jgi:hypothetical protein
MLIFATCFLFLPPELEAKSYHEPLLESSSRLQSPPKRAVAPYLAWLLAQKSGLEAEPLH